MRLRSDRTLGDVQNRGVIGSGAALIEFASVKRHFQNVEFEPVAANPFAMLAGLLEADPPVSAHRSFIGGKHFEFDLIESEAVESFLHRQLGRFTSVPVAPPTFFADQDAKIGRPVACAFEISERGRPDQMAARSLVNAPGMTLGGRGQHDRVEIVPRLQVIQGALIVAEKLCNLLVGVPALKGRAVRGDMPSELNQLAFTNQRAAQRCNRCFVRWVHIRIICAQGAITEPGNSLAKLIHAPTILHSVEPTRNVVGRSHFI